jgi:hypothetical protein
VYGDLSVNRGPLITMAPTVWILNIVGVTPVLNTNGCINDEDPRVRVQDSETDSDVLIVNTPSPSADTVA